MEQRCPTPSRGPERLPSAELASAFSGLTTSLTAAQLGQGRAPGSQGLAKRAWGVPPAGDSLLGGLQQGRSLYAHHQAKRR